MHETGPYDEREILQQVAEGDETAFRRLVMVYQRKLFSFLYKMTESRELTRDLVQDIFLDLWATRSKLSMVDNLNPYLHKIAQRTAYHHLQRVAREEQVLDHLKNRCHDSEDAGS